MASGSDYLGDWVISGEDNVDRQMVIYGVNGSTFWRYYQNEQPPNGGIGGVIDQNGIAFSDLNVRGTLSTDGNTLKDSLGNVIGNRTSFSTLTSGVSKVYQLQFKNHAILSQTFQVYMFIVDDNYVAWTVMMNQGSQAWITPIYVYKFSKVDDPQSSWSYTFIVQLSQQYGDWPQGQYTFYFNLSQDGSSISGSVLFPTKKRDEEDTFTATAKSGSK